VFKPGGSDALAAAPTRRKDKGVVAKSPDETGMLQMESMKELAEEDEQDAPKSATQFFTIPAKKGGAIGAAGPAPGIGMNEAGAAGGRALPGSSNPAFRQLPGVAPGGAGFAAPGPAIGGPVAGGPMVSGPMVSGPMVSGPVAGGQGTPFGVAGAHAPVVPPEEGRGNSWRVYAIILGLFVAVCAVMVLAVAGIAIGVAMQEDEEPTVAEAPSEPVRVEAEPDPEPEEEPVNVPDAKPRPRPRPKPSEPVAAPSAPPPPPPPAPPALGTLTVRVPADQPFTAVEVKCSNVRERADFRSGTATVPNVPTGEGCQIFFKGGAPASFRPVSGGQTLQCTFVGSTASCR
jgi:hypothetical protein